MKKRSQIKQCMSILLTGRVMVACVCRRLNWAKGLYFHQRAAFREGEKAHMGQKTNWGVEIIV